MTGTEHHEEVLEDMPPSAKLVYKVLEVDEPQTHEEISESSRLCNRTTRYATKKLLGGGVIEKEPKPTDPRQDLYSRTDEVE